MKKNNENFDKNISRMVKLTRDAKTPSKAFTESLMDQALSQLESQPAGRKRAERNRAMKIHWKPTAVAAAAIILCGIGVALVVLPSLSKEKNGTFSIAIQSGLPDTKPLSIAKTDGRKQIEYTETIPVANKPEATPPPPPPPSTSPSPPTSPSPLKKPPGTVQDGIAAGIAGQILSEMTGGTSINEKNMEGLRTDPRFTGTPGAVHLSKLTPKPQFHGTPVAIDASKEVGNLFVKKPILGDKPQEETSMMMMEKATATQSGLPVDRRPKDGGVVNKAYELRKLGSTGYGAGRGGESGGMMGGGGRSGGGGGYGGRGFGRGDSGGNGVLYGEHKYFVVGKLSSDSGRQPGGTHMAHGGATPPNAEDVDAMFFKNYGVNPFIDTEDDHLSTFATDVDTGSYTVARGFLQDGHLPPNEAVRVEEFVNYFDYHYAPPQKDTFAVYAEAAPWTFGKERKNTYLLRLGLKAQQISEENRKPAVLTFVIDVSGSMKRETRLELVKKCLRMLVDKLRPEDKIGIAVYGSRGKKIMCHKSLNEKEAILEAIRSLHAGGSTYAEEGIRIGYKMAEEAFTKGSINRVILCSDGVANVGNTGVDKIFEMIKSKSDKGITLSALGFGMGNYNDVLMERLGDKGNGYYAYIDTIAEAKRLFGNLTGALQVVARDVKLQVDFNPKVVRSYRLIGYENRDVPDDKFRDDKYDGGEMGAGHSATALYELKLWPKKTGTIATTYVRYKHPETFKVTEFKTSYSTSEIHRKFAATTPAFGLASAVTEFAEILRKSYWAKGAKLSDVLKKARNIDDKFRSDPDVIELIDLVSKANSLMSKETKEVEEEIEVHDTLEDTHKRY